MLLEPALGVNLKNCNADILKDKEWRVTEKIDGVRRLFFKDDNGSVSVYTRSGKIDPYLTHITNFLESPWFPSNTMYDCELVDRKLYFSKVESFILRTETAGKANQQYLDNKKDLIAICFDVVTIGKDEPGRDRNKALLDLFKNSVATDEVLSVPILGKIYGDNLEGINLLMNEVRKNGGEGLMLMDLDATYISGRSKSLIKVKRLEEYIGVLIDIEMAKENTKIEGGVAALLCKVDGCTSIVRVGSGLTLKERIEIAENPNEYIGRKLEIEAFSMSQDNRRNTSLSMPVFKQFIF